VSGVIVVTAAGGPTGTAVVRELRARGLSVRAVVNRRGPRPELAALGAEVVVAELTQPMAWSKVLAGADAVYLIWPNFDPDEAEGAPALFAEARRAGLPRLVYHSVLRPQLRVMPHHAAKDQAEEALDGSGLRSWRVLQPCAYADNLDGQLDAVRASGRAAQLLGPADGAVGGRPARRRRRRGRAADRGRPGRRDLRGGRPGGADRAADGRADRCPAR
jgi:uncharacterized protein YbjT (DUF2867 family)